MQLYVLVHLLERDICSASLCAAADRPHMRVALCSIFVMLLISTYRFMCWFCKPSGWSRRQAGLFVVLLVMKIFLQITPARNCGLPSVCHRDASFSLACNHELSLVLAV